MLLSILVNRSGPQPLPAREIEEPRSCAGYSNSSNRTATDTSYLLSDAGGNSLNSASPGKVADFVRSKGGHTVITKVSSRAEALREVSLILVLLPGPHRQQWYCCVRYILPSLPRFSI